jgi:hypothetical protein
MRPDGSDPLHVGQPTERPEVVVGAASRPGIGQLERLRPQLKHIALLETELLCYRASDVDRPGSMAKPIGCLCWAGR